MRTKAESKSECSFHSDKRIVIKKYLYGNASCEPDQAMFTFKTASHLATETGTAMNFLHLAAE